MANVLKCRPPNNRTPEPLEVEACRPYLERQVALIAPKLIEALGRSAASLLLGAAVSLLFGVEIKRSFLIAGIFMVIHIAMTIGFQLMLGR